MNNFRQERSVAESFMKALDQTSFVLKENPELVFPQAYNLLYRRAGGGDALKSKLDGELRRFKRAWLRILNGTVESQAHIRTLTGHDDWVVACAFSPDGRCILSANGDGSLTLWDAETGEELICLQGHAYPVWACAFSPESKRVLSGSMDNTLKLWALETGEELATFRGHSNGVQACHFSPDGKRIISAGWDNTLRLWDSETGQERICLKGHAGRVNTCRFSPDGTRVVLGDSLGRILLGSLENVEIHPHLFVFLLKTVAMSFAVRFSST